MTAHWVSLLAKVADGYTLIDQARRERLVELAYSVRDLPGDMAELGVYKGGSALLLSLACPHKHLDLFDTWAGQPFDDEYPEGHRQGEFACEPPRDLLEGRAVSFHQGVFPETALPLPQSHFSFVHVDCDNYQTVKAAVEFFTPRLVRGGVVVFDDHDWHRCPGVARVIREHGLAVETAPQQAWWRRP